MSDSLRPHDLQHARPPCPSPTPRVHSDSPPLSPWCHPAISSSVIPFCSCPQSLPASESFPMSQLFSWGGQSIGVSALASFLPKKSQDWSPLEWTVIASDKFQPRSWIWVIGDYRSDSKNFLLPFYSAYCEVLVEMVISQNSEAWSLRNTWRRTLLLSSLEIWCNWKLKCSCVEPQRFQG